MVLHRAETYPIRGFIYLIVHPSLWKQLCIGLIIMILMTIITSILLFIFVFPSQSYCLSEYMYKSLSWIISFFLTLFEIAIIIMIFSCLFLAYYMNIIFDTIWHKETMTINRGETQILSTLKGSCIKSFLILILIRVILILLTSPLNLIPIVGTIVFIYINGYYYAWSLHCRYFDLIGLTFAQGKHFVKENRSDYIRFGVVALLLEIIPLINIITPITNVIGSSLWASHIEKFKEPLTHPRCYLLSPSPDLIEQGRVDYGTINIEKQDNSFLPSYNSILENNIYPSAPPTEK